jgi:cobalt-zinc-cadmium efflux system outer membrane protein
VALALTSLGLARAQAPTNGPSALTPDRLALADARRLAFQRNWDLLAAKSDVDIALAQRVVAREFPNPTASFSVVKISADSHPSSTISGNGFGDRNYDTVAAVNQLIEIGGKRHARKDSAAAGLKGAEARLADARRLLDQGVTQAFVGVLLAERNHDVLADSATSLRQEARIAGVRQRAGDISLADQNQIEIAAERLELDAAGAGAEARKARVALEVLLGEKEPRGEIKLADSLDSLGNISAEATNPPSATFSRPDLVAAEAARAKAEADLRLQKAARIPDPTFLAQYEHQPPDQPHTVGLGVSFPLPLWNRNGGNIAAARATLEQAARHAGRIHAQVLADIAVTRMSHAAALTRWQRYRDELTPKSAQIRASVSLAYEKGGATLLDLLAAQRNDNEVRLATAQAAAAAANESANLRAALNLTDSTNPQTK